MAVVSDSNILSSLAAADALHLLFQLFHTDKIFIPKAVEEELKAGLEYGVAHLQQLIDYIQAGHIQVLCCHPPNVPKQNPYPANFMQVNERA